MRYPKIIMRAPVHFFWVVTTLGRQCREDFCSVMAKIDEMNHRKGGKMKKDWTWYTGVLEYYTCSSILYILHVRAILGKKAAQLPTRASGGAKNTKLDLLLGYCFFLRRTLNIRFLVCVPSCGYTESNCGQKGANLATY